MANNFAAYKSQFIDVGLDPKIASLAAGGCVALDEGRDRTTKQQKAIEAAVDLATQKAKAKQ